MKEASSNDEKHMNVERRIQLSYSLGDSMFVETYQQKNLRAVYE
jgi:hypothetical protein